MTVVGLVPIIVGLSGILMGPENVIELRHGETYPNRVDNNYRYLSGLLLGIGLIFWSLIPDIREAGTTVRILTFLVIVGGLGRLIGLGKTGMIPDTFMLFGLFMELGVTPTICYWQSKIVSRRNA
ncbi:unnamed protein product [Didymodactylos carnosus]|uniref:DUF4345 domain-containing protein n=1 Tax=Didymodactylos carnosus TaxID=1234261 RepID=A0A814W002_9BILA|nr:unnamed protein product [Didymodactylos carnosus]CAF1457312.1 unnamed protein product [Didymodactylos carnosus]CAF3959990.1 unnamed protein product [Didymodactylos carnosus]CAF4251285.1 unnamed protein product [Didymodactylos carnosus]